MDKIRLDKLLVERKLAQSRARAVTMISSGVVIISGEVTKDPSLLVPLDVAISLEGSDIPWVSRAGVKLDHALSHWNVDCKGKTCLDVGSSTGGFTQVLLSRGAREVFAIDVGTNQMHPSLKSDPRVVLMEQTHILEVPQSKIPRVDIMVVDLSFISLTKVFSHIQKFVLPHGKIVLLIKPQFEVGKDDIAKGVVRDEALRLAAVERVIGEVKKYARSDVEIIESPIEGSDGNKEYLLFTSKD